LQNFGGQPSNRKAVRHGCGSTKIEQRERAGPRLVTGGAQAPRADLVAKNNQGDESEVVAAYQQVIGENHQQASGENSSLPGPARAQARRHTARTSGPHRYCGGGSFGARLGSQPMIQRIRAARASKEELTAWTHYLKSRPSLWAAVFRVA
jgi:hypothetical protein